jgi:hypothetical protein
MTRHTIDLTTGRLDVTVLAGDHDLEALCGFAARRNPKRGFLFVSRVLGRHIPVRPSVMRETYRALAAKIDPGLPGPVLMVGMAETAVGLGQGVHEAYLERTGRGDAGFLATTRHGLPHPLIGVFEEPHSHATRHRLYRAGGVPSAFLDRVRTLVLIDDEASTGTTFRNLAACLTAALPSVARVDAVVLTDWSAGRGGDIPVTALLTGRYQWEARRTPAEALPPAPDGHGHGRDAILRRTDGGRWGTLGIVAAPRIAGGIAPHTAGGPVCVLGLGEFVHLPFRHAEALEAAGLDVRFQSVTRSPIRTGHAIDSVVDLPDPYGGAVPNYLYNYRNRPYAATVVLHETTDPRPVAALVAALEGCGSGPVHPATVAGADCAEIA